MRLLFGVAVLATIAPCLAWSGPASVPAPGPDVQMLGYYVCSCVGHGQTKAGPFGPAGKLSSEQTCEWFAGHFQVVCRGQEHSPTGTRSFLNVLSYDQATHSYKQYSISSLGESEYDQNGSLTGNTLTYVIKQNAGGKPATFRYTEDHVSPSLYKYRAEISLNQGPWTELAAGEIRKVR